MRQGILIALILICGVVKGQSPMELLLLGPDVPPVAYWTWNSSYMGTAGVLSGGNLVFGTVTGNAVVIGTKPGGTTAKSDDRYFEVYVNTLGNNMSIGVENSLSPNLNTWMGADSHGYGYYSNGTSGGDWQAGSLSFTGVTAFNSGHWVGILLKSSTHELKCYSKVGSTTTLEMTITLPAGSYYPAMSNNGGQGTANFGASPWQLAGAPFSANPWDN